ncbi:hypothetical protein G5V59_12235 [Nocardioides sp. W3-2-3]|uniref:hypothetical protein n=1 Tax=Nocardioides convexus TaxID=2712224 RepID=UPI0024185BDE|nr:hypothetical protein [Nocardioides convexus]NHA00533.1 hypothetical protein [Nocardioides convexus]
MRRLGLLTLPLAGALALSGAPAIADPVPAPGAPLTRVGTQFDSVDPAVVAVDAAGTRIATSFDGEIRESRAGGSWSAPRKIPRSQSPAAVQVAAGRPGTALAAYLSAPMDGPNRLVVQVRAPDRTWSAPHPLTTAIPRAGWTERVLGNDDGDYAVVYARSGVSRPTLYAAVRLRGDRWRTTTIGPVVGGFSAAMDATGAVYVVRDYGRTRATTTVRRIKRPGRALSPAVVLPAAPTTWTYLVERTGRQTLVVNTGAEARVLRQETVGGSLRTVWRRTAVVARAAVGGGRLRLTWQVRGSRGASAAWTQVVRPRAGGVLALGSLIDVHPAMDARGHGIVLWKVNARVSPGEPADDSDEPVGTLLHRQRAARTLPRGQRSGALSRGGPRRALGGLEPHRGPPGSW